MASRALANRIFDLAGDLVKRILHVEVRFSLNSSIFDRYDVFPGR